MAFERKYRQEIINNSLDTPTGYDFGHNEAAHIDHDRKSDHYQDPANGTWVNRPVHWMQHRFAEIEEIDNGLPIEGNKWAREKIWERMTDDEKAYVVICSLID